MPSKKTTRKKYVKKAKTGDMKPNVLKRKSIPKSRSTSKSRSSKSTRRVKFKSYETLKFDKREPVDSLLLNKKRMIKNKTLKNNKSYI